MALHIFSVVAKHMHTRTYEAVNTAYCILNISGVYAYGFRPIDRGSKTPRKILCRRVEDKAFGIKDCNRNLPCDVSWT